MKMLAHQNLHLFQMRLIIIILHCTPLRGTPKKDYDWGSNRSVLLKLSTNEVMQMASVFLRIMHTLKIDKRKTSHHGHVVYKNISVTPNERGGLLLSAGIVPVDKDGLKPFMHMVPVSQMDCVKIGLYILGYLAQKNALGKLRVYNYRASLI